MRHIPLFAVTANSVRVEAVTSTGGNTGAREIRFYSLG